MARDDHPQGTPTLARLAERFRLVCSHPSGLRPSTRSKSVSGPWSNRGELRLYLAERSRLRWFCNHLLARRRHRA